MRPKCDRVLAKPYRPVQQCGGQNCKSGRSQGKLDVRLIYWVLCKLGRHKRDSRRVAKRGSLYQAPCKYCGKRLQKVVDGGTWQVM